MAKKEDDIFIYEMPVRSDNQKIEFYKKAIKTLDNWLNENKDRHAKIDNLISNNLKPGISTSKLTTIMNYQLEYTKILYSCMALADKLIRTQERLEQYEKSQEI